MITLISQGEFPMFVAVWIVDMIPDVDLPRRFAACGQASLVVSLVAAVIHEQV